MSSSPTTARADLRLHPRKPCNILCRLVLRQGTVSGRITNISQWGFGLELPNLLDSRTLSEVTVLDGPLAGVAGVFAWASHPRYGVKLLRASAKLSAFYDTLSALPQHD